MIHFLKVTFSTSNINNSPSFSEFEVQGRSMRKNFCRTILFLVVVKVNLFACKGSGLEVAGFLFHRFSINLPELLLPESGI
jgi:hypothetical protein